MTPPRLPAAALAAAIVLTTVTACGTSVTSTAPSATPTATADAGPALPAALTPTQIAALPATTYDAVIPGLLAAPAAARIKAAYHVAFDTVVYGADFTTPVARIPAKDFLGEPTVVVRVASRGKWSQVLTAARQQLPSKATTDAPAPAQSSAWVRTSSLQIATPLSRSIAISASKQTLTIVDAAGEALQTFPVGVGTSKTPTPTGTGYLQARYLDPAQNQTEHRIQLTSLHATTADEPYGGSDGGLIGIHFQSTATGAVSHGCVRLSAEAIAAVDALPLGTAVQITA
ncbi:L,D-transpeptidase [Leifsonia sp. 2MCAF36]|uniref:L,D-transpeptidase n=1 Tax=Leifsonia sp. 2MCAF36 TaxID=3232988 RepID=UPI003F965991